MDITLITALLGFVAVFITAILTHRFTLKQHDLSKKREIYDTLLVTMNELKANSKNMPEDVSKRFCNARTSSLLIGSVHFLVELRKYEKCMYRNNPKASQEEVEECERSLIKQIRKDLGLKNRQGHFRNQVNFPTDIYLYDIKPRNVNHQ